MATKSSVIKNAEKAFKYSVKPVIEDRTPFMTGTVQSAVSAAKDLREWTIRNNPFRPVNGNKDPLVRQIANVAIRSVKDAKRDLMAGDLTFRRLNKTLMDFVGGGEDQFDFDLSANFDFDFGGGDSDFSFEGNDDSSSSSSAAIAGALSQDFAQSQMHATSAMIGAVEHATNKMTHAQMVVSESAVTRLISNNMTIAARTSSQLSGISSGIEAVNNNLSLLVQQGNDIAGFVNQSQRYMQNTEQSLNDIKALLQSMNPETKKRDHSANRDLPDFMDGHFDVKKYISYIFNDSSASFMLSSAVGTMFKALKLELPSFIDEMYAQPLQELNPIKNVVEKLFPAVDRLGNLDKVLSRTFETFMAKMNAGEYKGILNSAGLFDFGFERARVRGYSSAAYDKGTVAWNGKSERALQEVIPEYLSSMESYLEIIAKNTSKDGTFDRSNRRLYDYDEGKFYTHAQLNERAVDEMTYVVQSAFGETTNALEKIIKDSDDARQDMTKFLQKVMSKENIKKQSDDNWYKELYNIVSKHKGGAVREAEVRRIYEAMLANRRDAILNMNELKSAAGARDNFMYLVGDNIDSINPEIIYASKGVIEEKQYAHMSEEQKRKHDQDKKNEELKKGFMGKLKSTGMGKTLSNFIDDYKKKGGAINRMIDYGNDALTMLLTGLVHNIPSYDVGTTQVPHDQVAQVHKDEIIIPKAIADKIRAGQFSDKAVEKWLTEVSGITPEAKNMQGTLAQLQTALGTVAGMPADGDKKLKAQGAILDSSKEYYRLAINADAIKNGDVRQMLAAILENSANQTAMMAHNFEGEESDQRVEDTNDMIAKALGTKGEDGLYHGTALSQYANMGLDLKNAIKHALYGEEYTTSQGVKVAKDEDNVFSIIGNTTKKIGDTALTAIFGENYKDTKQFKALAKAHDDVKAGLTASAKGTQYEGAFVEGTYDEDHAPKSSGQTVITPQMYKEARMRANMSSKEAASRIGTNYQTLNAFEAGKNTKLTDEQLSILRQVLGINIEESTPEENERAINAALQETSEKSLELNKKFLGITKGALLGGIGFTAVGALGGTGIIPTLLTPGGPIGGAILGATASILSRNEGFMNMLFGEKDENGERVGGAISKEMQERWKGLGAKLLGPAVLGAAGGYLFPTLTKVATGGWLGSALIGGGPILGATLGIGTSLILRSKAVQDVLYGEEGKGGTTGIVGQAKTAAKQFWAKHKGQAKGMGLGALGGGLLGLAGGSALGLPGLGIGGLVIGTSLLGATMGIKAGSDKFNEFLFGTRKYETDKDGKKVFVGRDGDGFVGKMGRMISVNVLHPIERFAKSASDSFAEWIRYDIGYQIKSIFEPFTKSLETAVDYAADGFKSLGKKIFGIIDKLTKPIRVIAGSILKLAGRAVKGTLQTGLGVAGGIISAPLKVAGHIGRKLSGKLDPEISEHNKQFWKGHALNMINPFATIKNAGSAFLNSKGNFFDAIGDGARALNPFLAYGDARIKYAEKHGLTDSAAFMGGWLGGAGKEHKDIVRENRRKARNEKKLEALRKKWATADNYNDKLILDSSELRRRNNAIARIMGPGYENKSNEEMMEYIYDPFGHKKQEKNRSTEAVESINTYVSDISSVLHNILDYVSGAKQPTTPSDSSSSSSSSNTSSSYNDIKAKYERGEITKEEFDSQSDELAINQLDEMLKNGDITQEEYDMRMAELHISPPEEVPTTFRQRAKEFFTNKREGEISGAVTGLGSKMMKAGAGIGKFFKKRYYGAKALKNAVSGRYAEMIGDLRDSGLGEEIQDRLDADGNPLDLISEHEQSEAAFARRVAERRGEAATAADQPIEPDAEPIEVAMSEEQVEKMSPSSIFSKEGLLGSIGTIAIVGGIGFLLTKFPKLIEKIPELIGNIKDFIFDKAIPWVRDEAWPVIKTIGTGLGEAVVGIWNFLRDAPDKVYSFANFMETGEWASREKMESRSNTAASISGMDDDAMRSWMMHEGGLSGLTGKDINSVWTKKDIVAATYAYMGNKFMLDNNGKVPTAEELRQYITDHPIISADAYRDIYKKFHPIIGTLGPDPYGEFNTIRLFGDVDEYAIGLTLDYLTGARGDYYSRQLTPEEAAEKMLQAEGAHISSSGNVHGGGGLGFGVGYGHFLQTDPRWSTRRFARIGSGNYTTMANGGCGPTALANVAVQSGVNTNPMAIANIARQSGYTAEGGSTAKLFTSGAKRLGLKSNAIGTGGIRKALQSGRKVVFAGKGNGIYTRAGHIMSAHGVDGRGNIIVDDPMRRNSISVPLSAIGRGITHAWAIGRGDDEETTTNAPIDPNNMLELTKADTIPALKFANVSPFIYSQVDSKWSDLELEYDSGTMRNAGCLLSAIGSYLATLTGLNYRPDFLINKVIQPNELRTPLGILRHALPPSMSNGVAKRLTLHDNTHPAQTNTVQIRPNSQYGGPIFVEHRILDNGEFWVDMSAPERKNLSKDEKDFMNIVNRPFIIFGGSNFVPELYDSKSITDFNSQNKNPIVDPDGNPYTQHAMLVIPSDETFSGPSDRWYRVYNPGSSHAANQGKKYRFADIFDQLTGVQSVFAVDPGKNHGDVIPSEEDMQWMLDTAGVSSISELVTAITKSNKSNGSTGSNGGNRRGGGGSGGNRGESEEDESIFSIIMDALSKLGDIAMNALGSLFGGKYETPDSLSYYMSRDYGNGTSSANHGTYVNSPFYQKANTGHVDTAYELTEMYRQGLITFDEFNTRMADLMKPSITPDGQSMLELYGNVKKYIGSEGAAITPYNSLPQWARTNQLTYIDTTSLNSSLLNAGSLDYMLRMAQLIASKWESRGSYSDAYRDLDLLSIGINGFHGENASEIMERIIASKMLSAEDAEYAKNVSEWARSRLPTNKECEELSTFLAKSGVAEYNKQAQDAFSAQFNMYGMNAILKLYDEGILKDPRSVIALTQFTGFGHEWLPDIAESSIVRDSLINHSTSAPLGDELANTILTADAFYRRNSSTYTNPEFAAGYKNRWHDVYMALTGADDNTTTNVLGFGGGIRDSYRTDSYDIVDTPFAINKTPRVEVDVVPVTNRLDVIISYLKQIAIGARNAAGTAATNLDIGYGLKENQKLSNAGIQRKENIPIYTENNQSDKLKQIHDRIARSPRPV